MLNSNKLFIQVVLTILVFVLQFDLDHHQIGLSRHSREAPKCSIGPSVGTTKNLKEIFIGRCHYFVNILRRIDCVVASRTYDCNLIWDTFYNITTKSANCATIDSFTPLLNLTDHEIPENTSLFWSGTYTPAHQYTKISQYWSLEDTLIGFLLDETVFCKLNSNFDYSNPTCYNDCNYWNFWSAASKRFAEKARGSIIVVLNGSRSIGAISNSSTFFNHELPNFKDVKKLTVLLLLNPSGEVYESCKSSASLKVLQSILKTKNITYECNDNPKDILFYMCFLDPLSKECQSIKFSLDHGTNLLANKLLILCILLLVTFKLYSN